MATKVTMVKDDLGDTVVATWDGLTQNENGDAVMIAKWPTQTVHVEGTFDTATLTIQGSNDGVNWVGLTDSEGAALTFTTGSGIAKIEEVPLFIRPSVSNNGTTNDIDVIIVGVA